MNVIKAEMAQLLSPYGEPPDDYVRRVAVHSFVSELPLPHNSMDAREYQARLESSRAQYLSTGAALEAALTEERDLFRRMTQELSSHVMLTPGDVPLPREWAQEERLLGAARARTAQERTKHYQSQMDLLRYVGREASLIDAEAFRSQMGRLLERLLDVLLGDRLQQIAYHEAESARWYREGDSYEALNAQSSQPQPPSDTTATTTTTTAPKEDDPMTEEEATGAPSAPEPFLGRTPSA
jgi:hypothetical protein